MRIPDPIANTTTEAYLAYKAGVLAEGDLKPKLYDPYIHLDAWLAYWAGLTKDYPVKNVGKNLFNIGISLSDWFQTFHDGVDINSLSVSRTTATIEDNKLVIDSYNNTGYTWISRWVSLEKNTEYVISGKNTQAIRIVGFNSKELSSEGILIKVKAKAPNGGTTTFNTGDYNYYALSFYPSGANEYFEDVQIEKGSTATAYEPYAGEPEMLTDEEALIAYLSGVTDTYPEEFRDPADVRVAAYLKYLVSARWGRPEYPVTNEELYLSMMDAPYIPAGEPSSDIEIDDTAEAPFKDVKMYGDTSQTTYTGKNLCGIPDQTLTYSGVTFTFKDGELTLDGTASGTGTKYFVPIKTTHLNGSYTVNSIYVSGTSTAGGGTNFNLRKASDDTLISGSQCSLTPGNNNKAVSVEDEDIKFGIYLYPNGAKFENFKVKLQLVSGSTADYDFEPYVGGVPAPNPDYPQAVNTVTGRQVVKVEGKNLYKWNDVEWSNPITTDAWCFQNGSSTAGGGAYGPNITDRTPYKITLPAGTYKATAYNISSNIVNIQACKNGTPSEVIITSPVNINSSSPTSTITLTEETTLCFRYRVTNPSLGIGGTKIQLEKGSTATDYLPYQSGEYEINLGKNLFDKDTATLGYRIGSDGLPFADGGYFLSDYIQVSPNSKYEVSPAGTTADYGSSATAYYDSSKAFISRTMGVNSGWQHISTPANCAYIRFTTNKIGIDSTQLELGSTATSYAPYFTPIELCKIGVYQDYIYEDEGEWKIRSRIVKTKLVSTIGDWSISSFDTQKRLYIPSQNAYGVQVVYSASNNDPNPQVCSHFTNISATDLLAGETGIAISSSGYLSIRDNNQANAQDFKDWLDENEPVAYAVRANPTDILITNTALIEQLNALKAGGSYNGKTYIKITATDPNLPALLKVEAYKYD